MSEMIEQLIGEVRERSLEIKRSLTAEREKSSNLLVEKASLTEEIEKLRMELKMVNDQVGKLQNEIDAMETKNIEQPTERRVSQEEIDDLVKEIDYCITQLKQ
jgi:predicted  nucleic acid-binding Zn-ribbon protein